MPLFKPPEVAMPRMRNGIRDFPGKRWLNVGLRTAHLLAVVLFGAALLGAGDVATGALLTLGSGLGMFVIDLWANPAHLREVAGFGVIVKLTLLGLAAIRPELGLAMFWAILILSTLLSHAPGNFRHRRLF
jgi:hypothetical protein